MQVIGVVLRLRRPTPPQPIQFGSLVHAHRPERTCAKVVYAKRPRLGTGALFVVLSTIPTGSGAAYLGWVSHGGFEYTARQRFLPKHLNARPLRELSGLSSSRSCEFFRTAAGIFIPSPRPQQSLHSFLKQAIKRRKLNGNPTPRLKMHYQNRLYTKNSFNIFLCV